MTVGPLPHIDIVLPDYAGSHPFSRTNHRFHTRADLGFNVPSAQPRTTKLEQWLTAIYWLTGVPVPYAFTTRNGETRSIDKGCLGFLLSGSNPRFAPFIDDGGLIVAVVPSPEALRRYEPDRQKLLKDLGAVIEWDLPFDPVAPVDERRRALSEQVVRDGAAEFRKAILSAWSGKCAVTGESLGVVLDAAHIHPYYGTSTNDVRNGLLLRTDLHRLFDNHLMAFVANDDNAVVQIAPDLGETGYGRLHGHCVHLPDVSVSPDHRLLAWHASKAAWLKARGAD